MAQIVHRILGIGFDGKPIYAPKRAHLLLLAAAGGGKTTCGAVPTTTVARLRAVVPDNGAQALIEEFPNGQRNLYWRLEPRALIGSALANIGCNQGTTPNSFKKAGMR
ncbi:hypothetical protein [Stappia sp.]|uniref:hypothetical protein n=1 Tax=Stappia sp. TaxID=1870903 RepID=UPI003D10B270